MSNFTVDISKIVKKTQLRTDQVARGIKIELFGSVIMDTRVDTGRLRGNWQTQEGTPIMTETDRLDILGTSARDEVARKTGSGVTYLTNNLPYAKRWEDEDAMVGKNVAQIEQIVRREAAKA